MTAPRGWPYEREGPAPIPVGCGRRGATGDCPDHPLPGTGTSEQRDRRQRAREAGLDAYADVIAVPDAQDRAGNALDDAIETATRVRVDADITQAVRDACPDTMITGRELKRLIEVAFAAAGFEVEQ